jgi:hypothetical protein
MTDIEQRLAAAMHAAVDAEEAAGRDMLRGVYRRHRRHTLLVAGLAVLIAVVLAIPAAIVAHSRGGTPLPAAPHSLPKHLPAKMTGLPMPADTNLELLDQGEWYSTGSQSAEAIAGLPKEAYAFTRVPGGWAVTVLLGGWTCPPHCWNGQYFIADGSTQAIRIGTGWQLAASDRPGAVWLLSYARTITSMTKASAYVQLFSTPEGRQERYPVSDLGQRGTALGPRYRLPAGYLLARAVGTYLLLDRWYGHPVDTPAISLLWDPRSKRIVGRFPDVIDASSSEIAWSPGCRGCHVELLNVTTGKRIATPIPGGQPGGPGGSFTDDGTLLAVQLPSGQLAVYSTSSRALTSIPGTALNFSAWQIFGWLNGSHTLVVTAGPGTDDTTGPEGPDQLAYWQPGDSQLRIANVTDQGEIGVVQSWAS